MAEQRSGDEIALKAGGGGGGGQTIDRPVAELDNRGGDSLMAAEQRVSYVLEDKKELKKLDPEFSYVLEDKKELKKLDPKFSYVREDKKELKKLDPKFSYVREDKKELKKLDPKFSYVAEDKKKLKKLDPKFSYVLEDKKELKKPDPKFGEWDTTSHGASDSYTSIFRKVREEEETLDFGRDTNRLAYFSVGAFNLHGDDDLARMTDYGGGGGSGGGRSGQIPDGELANSGNGEVVVGILDQKRDGGGSGGGDRSPQIAVRGFASHGDTVDQKGDGGGEGRGVVVTRRWEKWSSCWRCGK